MPHYIIQEYGTIYPQSNYAYNDITFDRICVPVPAFEVLKSIATENTENQVNQVITFHKKGGKEYLKVKNFVGVIEIGGGFCLEILPKIYPYTDIKTSKRILITMLRSLPNLPFIALQEAHLQEDKSLSLLDIFVKQFLKEIEEILKIGLKSDYIVQEEAQPYLQGKIIIGEDLKSKLTQPEQFYIQFQALVSDTPANRLIKSTLIKLEKLPTFATKIRELLFAFDHIAISAKIESDIALMEKDIKSYKSIYYEKVYWWIRLFWEEHAWTPFHGNNIGLALLFPMQRVFEMYITNEIKKKYQHLYKVVVQEKKLFLIESPQPLFGLQPDIVLKDSQNQAVAIVDMKWKLLNEKKRNWGVEAGDIYQIYVYGQKYNCKQTILIFPQNADFQETKTIFFDTKQEKKLQIFAWEWEKGLAIIPSDTP
jgi:5-methylcytosine-specific restriction enzyme subunit McrC